MATDQNIHSLKNTNPSLCLFCIVRWALQDIGGACLWGRKVAKGGQRWQPHLEKLLKGGVEPPLHVQNTFKEELLDVDEVPTVFVVKPRQPNCSRTGKENTTTLVWWIFFACLLLFCCVSTIWLPAFKSIGKTIRGNKISYHALKSLKRVVNVLLVLFVSTNVSCD